MLKALIAGMYLWATPLHTAGQSSPQEVVEVRAPARQAQAGAVSGFSVLDDAQIASVAPRHPNELFDEVPGVWITRGSGQEHLTALRSPVLTGPGACGAFMVMEDHVPIRPAGFCNVNELLEVNLLQARSMSVLRGPGSVAYGSNALHGIIDVESADPEENPGWDAAAELGSHSYHRVRLSGSGRNVRISGNATRSESFRDDEKYEHEFVNAVWKTRAGRAAVRSQLSLARLDQDTAGFIPGQDAYRDPALRKQNLNPEAFREAEALRLTSHWSWQDPSGRIMGLTPYLRSSDMEFLQHFLPGKPLERNGQDSIGMLFSASLSPQWSLGVDLEWAEGYLWEYQENPTQGSVFIIETRPKGFHYDYRVRASMLAAWAQWQRPLEAGLTLTAGLRAEILTYDYTNRLLDGNTRDDGSECGYGGCLYQRPADRRDRFNNLAPELGLNWAASPQWQLRARIATGFRVPQATELYRLQRGQQVADLESETLDTVELGLHRLRADGALLWDVTAFAMRKRHVIFRDANGFNVSDGETTHRGLEASLDWQMSLHWRLGANASYARHRYAFDRPASGIRSGNTVDTAPEWLAGARLRYEPNAWRSAQLEWVHTGAYELDPANAHRYEGHDLFNLRVAAAWPGSPHRLSLRVSNLLDRYYAERADYAFGNYRYFPGAGRQVYLSWEYRSRPG